MQAAPTGWHIIGNGACLSIDQPSRSRGSTTIIAAGVAIAPLGLGWLLVQIPATRPRIVDDRSAYPSISDHPEGSRTGTSTTISVSALHPRRHRAAAGRPAALSDASVAAALGGYADLVQRVLSDPERWLGLDEDPPPSARFPVRVLDAVRDRAFGETNPASAAWAAVPLRKRVDWWLRRIAISAGLAAAAPRLAGALADRLPLQDALGAAAAGLAVCATAREHGITEAEDWVPLLSAVILGRQLSTGRDERERRPAGGGSSPHIDPDDEPAPSGVRRAAATVWRLARTFGELRSVLDERPRGLLVFRAVGKVPVVGLIGGWLDERGGIRRASKRTARLLGR